MATSTTSGIGNQTANPIEKRKCERFPAKDGAMLAFTSADDRYYTKIVKMADISRGGAAFESDLDESDWSHGPCLEIFGIAETYLCIKKIPYKVVYIHDVIRRDPGTRRPKSCGLKFGKLLTEQKSQLDRFISAYGAELKTQVRNPSPGW
jgi:hypothetical protein